MKYNLIIVISAYFLIDCQSKQQEQESREISHISTETSDIVISDSAATQTKGIKIDESWIVPDHVILENLSGPTSLKYYQKLLLSTELKKTLEGKGPFTLFIPTDSAFQKLDPSLRKQLFSGTESQERNELIKHHLVSGKIVASDLADGVVLKAADGNELLVSNSGRSIKVDDAVVKVKDGVSSNGVIHIIDRVLLPENDLEK